MTDEQFLDELGEAMAEDCQPKKEETGLHFELNEGQKEAVKKTKEWLKGDEKFFGIFGYAGTGKTTTVQQAVKDYTGDIAMTAPTHKAVGVLASMNDGKFPANFATIHSLCAVKMFREDGERVFRPDPNADQPIRDFGLVIVDECSMISKEMWGWIKSAIRNRRTKVLVMGDPAQLPPVGEKSSPTFDVNHVTLTEIMRNQGAIQEAATTVRENIMSQVPMLPADAIDEHGELLNLTPDDWLKRLIENADKAKALAFTNKSVDWINKYVREHLYGPNAEPFVEGERLVLIETYEVNMMVTLHTEAELIVKAAERAKNLDLDCWCLTVSDGYMNYTIYVLDETQRPAWLKEVREAKDKGRALGGGAWGRFYALTEAFARVRSGWATTIHKSQGSTYEQVYMLQSDIIRTADRDHAMRNMLLYVGYSRARKGLYLS